MALAAYDSRLAKFQEEQRLARLRGPTPAYTGPKVKFEETGFYKALVRTGNIEEELTRIRDLIRKRTDPSYEPEDDDFGVQPTRKFDTKANYYDLLDVDDFATAKDIKAAYRKLVLKYHPDKNSDKSAAELREMQAEFERIQEAYEVLSHRATRRQYDRAKFDEARARSQGMGSGWYDKNNNKDNYWARWSATAKVAVETRGQAPKLSKTPAMRVTVWISLDKALRGGLKIVEVKRDRMQRSTGGASKVGKTFHVPVEPGQTDGSEHLVEGDGHWRSVLEKPGDLVFEFKHKPHPHLRVKQDAAAGEGDLGLTTPIQVTAKALDPVLVAWSPTFKRQMVLVRFLNPLMAHAPSRACDLSFYLAGEGLPLPRSSVGGVGGCSATASRGRLRLDVQVHLDGEELRPSLRAFDASWPTERSTSYEVFQRRHTQRCNGKPSLCVHMERLSGSYGVGAIRIFKSDVAVACVWEAPASMDVVKFLRAACALAWQASQKPQSFAWGFHAGLVPPSVVDRTDEHPDDASVGADGEEADDAVCDFLIRHGLAPKEGFHQQSRCGQRRPEETGGCKSIHGAAGRLSSRQEQSGRAQDSEGDGACNRDFADVRAEQSDEEDRELEQLVREKQREVERIEQRWAAKRKRLQQEREQDETVLKELLEKDKEREKERIEKEMSSLRSTFEFQVQAEERWRNEFLMTTKYDNEFVCVFEPAMVARAHPSVSANVTRRIKFNEVIKAKGKVREDGWLQIAGKDSEWALTRHPTHGRLLQKWFGREQAKFLELEQKIEDRRKIRNDTFLDYQRKQKEVDEWAIPPGPSPDELQEVEDDENEQLHQLLGPVVAELREAKRKLRALRKRRLDAFVSLNKSPGSGCRGTSNMNELPMGFRLIGAPAKTSICESPQPPKGDQKASSAPSFSGLQTWELKKRAADSAVGQNDWHVAVALYTEAVELGGQDTMPAIASAIFANRAFVYGKLEDWQRSLQDARVAVTRQTDWPKAWLRQAVAELRLGMPNEALSSLQSALSCHCISASSGCKPSSDVVTSAPAPTGVVVAFLGPVAECEAALYDGDTSELDGMPRQLTARIQRFKEEGMAAFGRGELGHAIVSYSRALYHRSALDCQEEAVFLSNRAAALLKLGESKQAFSDAVSSAERCGWRWPKPFVRAGQAAFMLQDLRAAYKYFAKAHHLDSRYQAAADGVHDCLRRLSSWEYLEATQRWRRFAIDRARCVQDLRIWAVSDIHFDQHGGPEWCKSLSSTFFRDDVLLLAGNVADSISGLRFGLTVLKSKFRRIFFVPGNRDVWVRRTTISDLIQGASKRDDEVALFGDSMGKFLEVLKVCDDLGVDTAPAEVAQGVFVAPLFSWYSQDFVPRAQRKLHASKADADVKVTIDAWVKWPFAGGSDDAWRFFMRMNEPVLRATIFAKSTYERLSNGQATVFTMSHFMPRPELPLDWTVPGIWDHIGCLGLDDQLRALGSKLHVYGRACIGARTTSFDGVDYVHNFLGTPDQHRPGTAPWCVFDGGKIQPTEQPVQGRGFNFKPVEKLVERIRYAGG